MIENKVAQSELVNIRLEDLYPQGERATIDLKEYLQESLILREKPFRTALKNTNWLQYRDKFVAVHCSADVLVPAWAFMLISVHLEPYAAKVIAGDPEILEEILFREAIERMDMEPYKDKKVLINGCSGKVRVPSSAFANLAMRLRPVAQSIMYGEACSNVPLYKKSLIT